MVSAQSGGKRGDPPEKWSDMEDKLWILQDLNMLYIRQIALSLQDTDIQKRIDHEVRMREGALKLLAACSQREQALEAAKSLLVCNSRIMTYMSELQHLKEEQVLQHSARRPSDAGCIEERLPCKGKVSISDLRIPLMWKDSEYFKNKGERHRCAVFCALLLRGEVFDTEMVFVDRTSTDICFENGIVFAGVDPGFALRVQLYSCAMDDDASLSGTPRKLAHKLSSSLGRSSGRRIRAALEGAPGSPTSNGGGGAPILLPTPSVPGPKFHLLAQTQLALSHVQHGFRTHDLTINGSDEDACWLPLYGSVCCRLAAQPDCMSREMMSGFLQIQAREQQGWRRVFCVLRGCRLLCHQRPGEEESAAELTISVSKETRIRASERDGQCQAQSLCISNRYGSEEVTHTLRAESRADLLRWLEAFWQHFYDMSMCAP
ncbi:rhotekin, partial [Ascaphus truei]|uniref:rhotekin n=1 Tax=Ascaphus truei TaxID=8439 RepID=UPI003F5A32F9